jgi:hypothetical protein
MFLPKAVNQTLAHSGADGSSLVHTDEYAPDTILGCGRAIGPRPFAGAGVLPHGVTHHKRFAQRQRLADLRLGNVGLAGSY